jgi:hypothetical protein
VDREVDAELAREIRSRWIEEHPDVRKAECDLSRAECTYQWNDDPVVFAENAKRHRLAVEAATGNLRRVRAAVCKRYDETMGTKVEEKPEPPATEPQPPDPRFALYYATAATVIHMRDGFYDRGNPRSEQAYQVAEKMLRDEEGLRRKRREG